MVETVWGGLAEPLIPWAIILFLKVWHPKEIWTSPALRGHDVSATEMKPIEVAASNTEHHPNRTAQKNQNTNHHEGTKEKADDGR